MFAQDFHQNLCGYVFMQAFGRNQKSQREDKAIKSWENQTSKHLLLQSIILQDFI